MSSWCTKQNNWKKETNSVDELCGPGVHHSLAQLLHCDADSVEYSKPQPNSGTVSNIRGGGGTLQGTSPMPDWSMVVHVHVWLILCCIFSALNFTLRPFTPLTEPASSACFCEQDNAQKNSAKANGFPISKEPTPSPHFIHTLALSCMVWQKASLHRRHAKFDLRGQCCQGWQSQSIDVS